MCLKFCEDYFGVHIFIIMFPSSWKKKPFPGRSNRDTLTHIVHVVKSKFPSYSYAPDCTFSSRKMKKLPTVGGGTPPSPRSIATLPRAWSLRSLAKFALPNVLAHYATARCPPPPRNALTHGTPLEPVIEKALHANECERWIEHSLQIWVILYGARSQCRN